MKKELRQKAILQREKMNLSQISKLIRDNIVSLPQYQAAKNIGIFYPKSAEIDLISLCSDKSKTFYLPKIANNNMEFYRYEGENNIKPGLFNIYEPTTNDAAISPDMIITPALMADKRGYRLGWGGGFYDRYLKDYKGIIVCPVPHCQLAEELPQETHDIKCHFVITEDKIIKIF